jgi:hypothetical protein
LNLEVNNKVGEVIKKSNLYFHLQKLEEAGLVKMVDQIPTGKKYITYYGRTAKAFLPHMVGEKSKMYEELLQEKLPLLIEKISPEVDLNEINDTLAKSIIPYFMDHSSINAAGEWLQTHQSKIIELDIDVRRIIDILKSISAFNPKTIEAMQKLMKLLKFEL